MATVGHLQNSLGVFVYKEIGDSLKRTTFIFLVMGRWLTRMVSDYSLGFGQFI